MSLFAKVLSAAVLSIAVLSAQPIPAYNSVEDYCRENPHAPTCKDGKPIDMQKAMKAFTNPLQSWCDDHPNEPVCRKESGSTSGAKTRTVTPRSAGQPRSESAPEPEYRLPSPQARRTKGSPADIRLGEFDWRLVDPHADLLIGINLASLVESELASKLIREWSGKLGATEVEQNTMLATLGNVTEAVISVHANEFLAVLMGRLDDFPEGTQGGRIQCARVSVDTVMMGSPGAITWARHRLHFGLLVSTQLKEAQHLAGTYHFWAWAKPSALAALGQGVSSSTPVTKIKFGVNLKDQFRMDMIMDTASAQSAQRVMDSSQKGAPREMQASIEGSSVHYALVLERDVALARFASFMTDSIGKQFAPLLAAARQMARQGSGAARSAPGKIVIEGLDDGPKAVQVGPKQ